MKRSMFALPGCIAVLVIGLLISVSARSQSETCTVVTDGSGDGHCAAVVDPNGHIIGYACFAGSEGPNSCII